MNTTRTSKRSLLASTTFWVLLIMLGTTSLLALLFLGGTSDQTRNVIIPRGSSLKQVSEILSKNQIIEHPKIFQWLLRLTGGNHRVRAGEFRFSEKMQLYSAMRVLYKDEPIVYPITIPEGWNIRQIADLVEKSGLGSQETFVRLAFDPNSPKKYTLSSPTLEGFLFPDTYYFSKIDGEDRILDTMVQNFFSKVSPGLIHAAKAKKMSLEQLVTLASIIEKETGQGSERTLISSVFHNRLRIRMRLQSDPTTIYGIPHFDGNIRKKDLLTHTPYNTYTIYGLPPGPIASPGLEAIRATINPAQSKFLYFVSNNKGKHIFSETYREHSRHVNSFQKRAGANR